MTFRYEDRLEIVRINYGVPWCFVALVVQKFSTN
jgi:hypothetical protein